MFIAKGKNQLEEVNYYHKALHLGCCNSPRSAPENIPPFVDDFFKLVKMKTFDRREFQIMFCFFQWFTAYCTYQVNKFDL